MPVSTRHPEYEKLAPVWKLMRDLAEGQRAVHGAGEQYLPKLNGESEADYKARKGRALFFNATWRTIDGLRGMLFRKPPTFKLSALAEAMLDDVGKDGTNAETFAMHLAGEVITVGRVGVLVDYPAVSTEGLTLAAVQELNVRPHLCAYRAESIINWATSWQNNRTMLSRVVLFELATIPGADEFEVKTEERYRVLDLDGGKYRVRVFRRSPRGEDELISMAYPLMNGAPLSYIPFQFFGVDSLSASIESPPLEDLANVNISHYQTTADLEHGAHKTALPQPWIAGISASHDPNGNPINPTFYMGGGEAWAFPMADTKVGMLEYTGAGLETLEKRLAAKENQMAVLGARMLEAQKKEAETAETASIHRSGEHATLASVAATLSRGLHNVFSWFDQWAGGTGDDVVADINKKFFTRPMTPEELTAHVAAWQSGAISKEQLFDNLKAGEVVADGANFEDEETKIANAPPTLPGGPDDQVPPAE